MHGPSAAQHLVHTRRGGTHAGGSSHPHSAWGSQGSSAAAQFSSVLSALQHGNWQALSCGSEFSEQLTQEANQG